MKSKTFTIFYNLGEGFEFNTKEDILHLDGDTYIKYKYMLNYSLLGIHIDVLELHLKVNNTIYNMMYIDNIEKFGVITLSISDYKIFKIRG